MPPSTKLELPANHAQLPLLTAAYKRAATQANLNPRDAAAWADLASVALEAGLAERGLELAKAAVELGRSNPRLLYILGRAQRANGDVAGAIDSYRKVVRQNGDFVDGWVSLGLAHRARRDFPAASQALRRAVLLDPNRIECHLNLGNIFADRSEWELAVEFFGRAVQLNPRHPQALFGAVRSLFELSRFAEARPFAEALHAADPEHFEGWLTRSRIAFFLEDRPAGIASIDAMWRLVFADDEAGKDPIPRAFRIIGHSDFRDRNLEQVQARLALAPDRLPWRTLEAYALLYAHQVEEGEARVRALMQEYPADPATVHLASYNAALRADANWSRAIHAHALEAFAGDVGPMLEQNHGMMLMLDGDYPNGLPLWESRFRTTNRQHQNERAVRARAPWDGGSLEGKRLYVWAEQGMGDSIQMARFAPMLAARGATVLQGVPPPLVRLFQTCLIDRAGLSTSLEPEYEDYDFHVPDCSLMHRLGVTIDSIPAAPYMKAPAEQAQSWAARLPERTGLRVGIVWSGNPLQAADPIRSVRPADLAPLAEVPGIQWFNLQKGKPAPQFRGLPPMPLIDYMNEVSDFTDTAALIENLDLVISVDTSVVHLAGALGKPVWLFNRSCSEWRWLTAREYSPWYPTVRIFRQQQLTVWGPVIETMAGELARLGQRVQSG